VAWYSTITVYVAIKGAGDIKSMLINLAASQDQPPGDDPASPDGPLGEGS
jgi:hypothetical protein